MKIWVDDIRLPPGYGDIDHPDIFQWAWCKTSADAIQWLELGRDRAFHLEVMSLDHDLGDDDTTRVVVLWCCENNYWPDEVVVHSANPVGREWLESMIERYKP